MSNARDTRGTRAATTTTDDDAELLRLCAEFHRMSATANDKKTTDDESNAILEERHRVSHEIVRLPSSTNAGRGAKASFASAWLQEMYAGEEGCIMDYVLPILRELSGNAVPPGRAAARTTA
jgi:hypothetical protein